MGPAEEAINAYVYSSEAKRTYDPKKGASLDTHIAQYMQKKNRDDHYSASTLKSSEGLGLSINKLHRAHEEYYMTHGKYPSTTELSKITGTSPKLVDKHMRTYKVKTVGVDDFTPKSEYVDLHSLLPDLSGTDKVVADAMSSGMPLNKALKKTKLSKSSYYRASNSIRDRMRKAYLRTNTLER